MKLLQHKNQARQYMFTIRNRHSRAGSQLTISGILVVIWLLVCTLATGVSAQPSYKTIGYIFLHPFFNEVPWEATLFTSWLDAPELFEKQIASISFDPSPENGTTIFTTAEDEWFLTSAPLANDSSLCGRPTIIFEDPIPLTMPEELSVVSQGPFCIQTADRSPSDSVYLLCYSPHEVYRLHIHKPSGAISSVDTLSPPLPDDGEITGIFYEPSSIVSTSTFWITGTLGFIAQLTVPDETITIYETESTETFLCIGNGFAGTESGQLFKREETGFVQNSTPSVHPIRSINGTIAVGDSGTILFLNDNGKWKSYATNNSNYRAGQLITSSAGTAVELLDESWNYSMIELFNTPTSIDSITPSSLMEYINNEEPYDLDSENVESFTLFITDKDANYSFPTVSIKSEETATVIGDSTIIASYNPTAICTTSQTILYDSTINVSLRSDKITLSTSVRRSVYDAVCELWRWKMDQMTINASWSEYDTLCIILSEDTLQIYNTLSETTVLVSEYRRMTLSPTAIHLRTGNQQFNIPVCGNTITELSLYTLDGHRLWRHALYPGKEAVITLPSCAPGIHILVVHTLNTAPVSHRIVIKN